MVGYAAWYGVRARGGEEEEGAKNGKGGEEGAVRSQGDLCEIAASGRYHNDNVLCEGTDHALPLLQHR